MYTRSSRRSVSTERSADHTSSTIDSMLVTHGPVRAAVRPEVIKSQHQVDEAAGRACWSSIDNAGKSPAQRRLRLALVGCGQISHAHLTGIHGMCNDCVEITVLIDPARDRAEELAKLVVAGGGRAPAIFASLDEAIMAEDVAKLEDADNLPLFEAVDVMLPHQLHLPVTLQCFAAKKSVLLEKPLAPTLAEADCILTAANQAANDDGLVFMMAENSQYWPEVQAAVDLIDSGIIGEVLTAKVRYSCSNLALTFILRPNAVFSLLGRFFHHYDLDLSPCCMDDVTRQACFNMRKSEVVYAQQGKFRGANGEESHKPWRYDVDIAGGGIVIDGGAHWLRPMRMFLGEVHSVVGVTSRLLPEMEGESFAQALLRFHSGRVGYFEAMAGPTLHLGVYGTCSKQSIAEVVEHGQCVNLATASCTMVLMRHMNGTPPQESKDGV